MKKIISFILLLALATAIFCGCTGTVPTATESDTEAASNTTPNDGTYITRAEWISELGANFGLAEYVSEEPYFADVPQDHSAYAFVQAAKEWNILRIENNFNPDGIATRAFVAETAMIAALQDYDSSCYNKSSEELIQLAQANRIMESTAADDLMTAYECTLIAEAAKKYSLTLTREEYTNIELKDGIVDLRTEADIQVNENVVSMPEELGTELKEGTVFIAPGDVNGIAMKVISVEKKDGQVIVTTQEPESSEVVENLDFYFVGTPSSIEDVAPLQEGVTIAPLPEGEAGLTIGNSGEGVVRTLAQVAPLKNDKKTTFKPFQVTVNLTKGKLTPKVDFTDYFSVEWSKQYKQLFGVDVPENAGTIFKKTNTIIKYDKNGKPILQTEKSWTLGYEITGTLKVKDFWIEASADATATSVNSFSCKAHLTVENSLKIKGKLEGSLPVYKVNIPGPYGLNFDVIVSLYVDFNGELQVGVTLDQTASVSYKKGAKIKGSQDTTLDTKVELSAKISTGVKVEFIVKFLAINLADVGVKAGVEIEGKTTLHQSKNDTMVCFDTTICAPTVSITVGKNKDTLLYKLKLQAELKLLAKSGGLIKTPTANLFHWEVTGDGAESVKKCTWGTRKPSTDGGNKVTASTTTDSNTTTTSNTETGEPVASQPEVVVPEKCQHNYSVIENTATCTAPGKKTYKCNLCGDSYSENVSATGHNWVSGECIACDAELPWTGENVDKDTILLKRGSETKTITVKLSHLPEEYDDGNKKLEIDVDRSAIYGFGQWIYYIEKVSKTTSSGGNSGTSTGWRIVKTSFDGTKTIKLDNTDSKLMVLDLIGVEDGYLYYFLNEGWAVFGETELYYLYKIKLDNNVADLIQEGTQIAKVDLLLLSQRDHYCESYIQDGTIHYLAGFEDEAAWAMMDLNGKNK